MNRRTIITIAIVLAILIVVFIEVWGLKVTVRGTKENVELETGVLLMM